MSIIYNLLGSILSLIFDVVQSYGWAIILFTILVKVILLPLTIKQTKSTKAMQDIQPKIQQIQEKYKNKPEKQQQQQQEMMDLYKEANINPLSGCLPLLIQLPILLGLFAVLREPWNYGLFESKAAFEAADTSFLWLSSLTQTGDFGAILRGQISIENLILAVLSGVTSYMMQKSMTTGDPQQAQAMQTMTIVMTVMSFIWGYTFPAGLAVYWIVSNLFSIAQQHLVVSPLKDKMAVTQEDVVYDKKPRNKK